MPAAPGPGDEPRPPRHRLARQAKGAIGRRRRPHFRLQVDNAQPRNGQIVDPAGQPQIILTRAKVRDHHQFAPRPIGTEWHGIADDLAVPDLQHAVQAEIAGQPLNQITLADQEVALAEETLKAEEARANVGRAVQRDVLEARVAVFDAKLQAAKARSDRQLAWIELQLLQGTLTVQSAVGK